MYAWYRPLIRWEVDSLAKQRSGRIRGEIGHCPESRHVDLGFEHDEH
jgi:hypothetical protein